MKCRTATLNDIISGRGVSAHKLLNAKSAQLQPRTSFGTCDEALFLGEGGQQSKNTDSKNLQVCALGTQPKHRCIDPNLLVNNPTTVDGKTVMNMLLHQRYSTTVLFITYTITLANANLIYQTRTSDAPPLPAVVTAPPPTGAPVPELMKRDGSTLCGYVFGTVRRSYSALERYRCRYLEQN